MPHLLGEGKARAGVRQRLAAIGIHLSDLLGEEGMVAQHALDLAPQERRQRPPIPGQHPVEAGAEAFPDALGRDADTVQREEALDAADDPGALLHQMLALASDPLRVLFLNRRDTDLSRGIAIAREPCPQRSRHPLGIEAIGLREGGPGRGRGKLAGSKTIVRIPRAFNSRARQKPS